MRRVSIILSIILLLTTSLMLVAQSNSANDAANTVEYLVNGASANVRSGPGTNFDIVGTVRNGESLLIYDEEPEANGWLRIYQFNDSDDAAYIADFLVQRAPVRFYSLSHDPIAVVSGSGRQISDVLEIPEGVYRIDAIVNDNAFILQTIVVEGNCDDENVLNELNFDVNRLELSGLFVSEGCSIIFETDNVDGSWEFAIRDILDLEVLNSALELESGSSISGQGRALTMPTILAEGIWEIAATANDRSFILWSRPLGECREESVFNELDFDATVLDMSAVYRVGAGGCIVFWETSNVDGGWEVTFNQIR